MGNTLQEDLKMEDRERRNPTLEMADGRFPSGWRPGHGWQPSFSVGREAEHSETTNAASRGPPMVAAEEMLLQS